jgi:WD40 repeat protein
MKKETLAEKEHAVEKEKIVYRGVKPLANRTTELIRRGLRDLDTKSNWSVKRIHTAKCSQAALSRAGQVAFLSHNSRSGQTLTLHDLELDLPSAKLPIAAQKSDEAANQVDLRWSPDGKLLLASSTAWEQPVQLFEAATRKNHSALKLTLNANSSISSAFAWSANSRLFAAACGKDPNLSVWRCSGNQPLVNERPLGTVSAYAIGNSAFDPDVEAVFAGFGSLVFSPDGRHLALTLKYAGDWADDLLFVGEVPTLQQELLVQASGSITDCSWTHDSRKLVYCAGGQAYELPLDDEVSSPLPFSGELSRCHDWWPLCASYSWWLRNSSKGRLSIVDLRNGRVVDECSAEGIIDLCWSQNGRKVYAATSEGWIYVFRVPMG